MTSPQSTDEALTPEQLAEVVAADIPAGAYVNLGIGQPTLVSDYLSPEDDVTLHTENGMLGMGRAAREEEIDPDLINAGKIPVVETDGCSYFHHGDSFAMMRGGHLDCSVLGAFQVDRDGNLANWHTGKEGAIPAVGGAMDLATGAKQTFVMMTLSTKKGQAKLVEQCTMPLTGVGCVSRVYTDQAVFLIEGDGRVVVRETYGSTFEQIQDLVPFALEQA